MRLLTFAALSMAVCITSARAISDDPFNPAPLDGDVIVSMPCDFKMVFRKVYTSPEDEKLKDKRFEAGGEQSKSPMAQNPREYYVQGGFHDKGGFYYLMSKYELSQLQYEALTADKCPDAGSKKLHLPVTNVSWFEMVEAGRRYSNSLQKAKDTPNVDGTPAYARLPTDNEWEFAERGGLEVSPSEFESSLPPVAVQSLRDYAWFQGSQSANGRLQLPGRLKPNELGIFDMLGNAQEMIFEPFRATRTGRLHGQSGGYILRGGGINTIAEDMSSSTRVERPYFTKGVENKSKDAGGRFVLAVPVASSSDDVRVLNEKVRQLGTEDNTGKAGGESNLDTVAMLDTLIRQNNEAKQVLLDEKKDLQTANDFLQKQNEDLSSKLGKLREQLVTVNAERDSMRDVAVVANIHIGTFLCNSLADEQAQYNYLKGITVKLEERCKENERFCQSYENNKKSLKGSEAHLKNLSRYYGDNLAEAVSTYDLSLFAKLNRVAIQGQGKLYNKFTELYQNHLREYKQNEKNTEKNAEKWISQCHAVLSGDNK